jgi:hypothetical protein
LNLINFSIPEPEESSWLTIKDFRKADFDKIPALLKNMYTNIKTIEPEFNYNINFENQSSPYLEDSTTYYKKVTIDQNYLDQNNTISVLVPRLMYNNFFITQFN